MSEVKCLSFLSQGFILHRVCLFSQIADSYTGFLLLKRGGLLCVLQVLVRVLFGAEFLMHGAVGGAGLALLVLVRCCGCWSGCLVCWCCVWLLACLAMQSGCSGRCSNLPYLGESGVYGAIRANLVSILPYGCRWDTSFPFLLLVVSWLNSKSTQLPKFANFRSPTSS